MRLCLFNVNILINCDIVCVVTGDHYGVTGNLERLIVDLRAS